MSKFKNLSLLFTLILAAGLSFNAYAGPFCGDNIVQPESPYFEECDEGEVQFSDLCNNQTDQFDGPCQFTICGDNVVQTPNGSGGDEQCEPPGTALCDDFCMDVTTTTTTTTTAAPTTTTTAGATTTTAAATTTTAGATTTTAA
ncbi:MAG: hypothetical protein WBP44_16880, partial [Gammaproteobacteria bacterium]